MQISQVVFALKSVHFINPSRPLKLAIQVSTRRGPMSKSADGIWVEIKISWVPKTSVWVVKLPKTCLLSFMYHALEAAVLQNNHHITLNILKLQGAE